jgi:lipopolysaccharide transport system permease protein
MHITGFYNIYTYRDLLFAWTMRTIRARYQQSVLGGVWAILQPAATVAIFTVIFTRFIPVDTGGIPYVVFSYTAMVPWTLFSGSITDMVDSLVNNMNLIGKIYFPRQILPVAALFARLLDFAIAGSILILLMIYYRMPMFVDGWLLLPFVLLTQLVLSLGIGLFGAALNVFYRDIRHLFVLGLQIWLYASPIIYPITLVPERLRFFYYLNPMAGIIEAYRAVLLYERLPDIYLGLSVIVALFIFFAGFWFFKLAEPKFADVI